jgi:hypothetical protein
LRRVIAGKKQKEYTGEKLKEVIRALFEGWTTSWQGKRGHWTCRRPLHLSYQNVVWLAAMSLIVVSVPVYLCSWKWYLL